MPTESDTRPTPWKREEIPMRSRSVLAAVVLLAAAPAFAQQDTEPEQPERTVVYRPYEEITFGEVRIDVPVKKPSGGIISGRGDQKFDAILEERVHFKKDLAKSIRLNVKVVETATTK